MESPKTIGDLVGPMAFSILMGTSRLIYGKYGDRFDLDQFMKLSTLLCIGSYLLIAFVPVPAVELVGCAIAAFQLELCGRERLAKRPHP